MYISTIILLVDGITISCIKHLDEDGP